MRKIQDLTGQKFGKLTVIERIENYISSNGQQRSQWKCQCECGTIVDVIGTNLTRGNTQSCGCSRKESNKKYNDYEIQDGYVIMYTFKQEPFLISLEDFWKVKDFCWHINNNGYVCSKSQKIITLSRFITDCPDGICIDHKDGNPTNNIRNNLRFATYTENNLNRKTSSYNTSGTTGVSWNKRKGKWFAYITINHKRTSLGYYNNFDDAVQVRKQAEEKYFGEWSYDNSRIN